MMHSTLLIDIGNTALKFCFEEDLSSGQYETLIHGDFNVNDLLNGLHKKNTISQIALSSVYLEAVTYLISQWCKDNNVLFVQAESGARYKSLVNAYQTPSELGVDRWLSMIAIDELISGAYTVISCGTAVTLDCVDSQGLHMGGVIMPGRDLMVNSLAQYTIAINGSTGRYDDLAGLSKNTSNAVDAGALLAITGMIEKVLSKVEMENHQIFITGGNSKIIKKNLNLDVEIKLGLVLKGLSIYLRRELSV